jgi:hypothetical protein
LKKKQAKAEARTEVKTKKREQLGVNRCEPSMTSTAVSKFRQEVEPGRTDPGWYTIKTAKKADFHSIKIIDDLLPEEVKQQLMKCTAS